MSVIAEFTLAPEQLSLAAALSAAPSVELDVSNQAVSERLRCGCARVIGNLFA